MFQQQTNQNTIIIITRQKQWQHWMELPSFADLSENCYNFFRKNHLLRTAACSLLEQIMTTQQKRTACQEQCCVEHPCGCWNVITWTLGVDECWTVHVPMPGSHQPDWFSCEPSGHWRRDWRTHQPSPDSVHIVMPQLKPTSTTNNKNQLANIFLPQNDFISVELLGRMLNKMQIMIIFCQLQQ